MNVSFIRHTRLMNPFDDYGRLSVEQLDDLAKDVVDPEIDMQYINSLESSLKKIKSIHENTIIFYSPTLRARGTAESIKTILKNFNKKKIYLIQLNELKEINFQPKLIISDNKSHLPGIDIIRKEISNNLFDDRDTEHVESLINTQNRINTVKEKIIGLTNKINIICITHGFLLKFLQMYFLLGKHSFSEWSRQDYEEMINFHYGSGFSIEFRGKKNLSIKKIQKRQKVFRKIRDIPYFIGNEKNDRSCITKHKFLAEALANSGLKTKFYECKFNWKALKLPSSVVNLIKGKYLSRHVYLKVFIPETGKYVVVDATWDKSPNDHFLVNQWTGFTDTKIAVPCISRRLIRNEQKKPMVFSELRKCNVPPEKRKLVNSINCFYSGGKTQKTI